MSRTVLRGPARGPRRERPARSVTFAQIEPTTRCNYTCGFCIGRRMDQSDLSLESFERVLEAFPDLTHIELQGEGEPLLHRQFFDMAERAATRGIRLSMITNGSLLTPERVERILDVGIAAIYVSIESPDPAAFQEIRGGRFEKVEAGLARLMAARQVRRLDRPKVGFAVTVLKSTLEALPDIGDLYARLGLDGGAVVQPLSGMPAYDDVYDSCLAAERPDAVDAARVRALVARSATLRRMLDDRKRSGHFYSELNRLHPSPHGCPWVKGGIFVDRHGNLLSCCMVKDAGRHALGTIGTTPRVQVEARRRALDERLTAGRIPEQCRGCGYLAGGTGRRRPSPRRPAPTVTAKPE